MTISEGVLENKRRRSDQVRARRARKTRRIERATEPIKPPRSRNRSPRRRRDMSVAGEMGAEVQLPAIPSLHLGPRLASIAMLVICVWTVERFLNSGQFTVSQVVAEGHQLLSESQIRSLTGVEGTSIFLIDPRAVEMTLEEESEIMEARVTVQWPDRVVADIVERPPSVEWNDGGRIWWLSEDGVAYVQHGSRSGLIQIESEVPVLNIQEDPTAEVVDPEWIAAAKELVAQMPGLQQIHFEPEHGLGFEEEAGWVVYFGTDGDIRMKTEIYSVIAQKLKDENIPATLVSIEDQNAPYYEVESTYSWQP